MFAAPVAAFSAYRSSDTEVAGGSTVIFDSERYDVSSSYDTASGVFTCPVDGYYFFSLSVFSRTNGEVVSSYLNRIYEDTSNIKQLYLPFASSGSCFTGSLCSCAHRKQRATGRRLLGPGNWRPGVHVLFSFLQLWTGGIQLYMDIFTFKKKVLKSMPYVFQGFGSQHTVERS